jgi:hypothetical protein
MEGKTKAPTNTSKKSNLTIFVTIILLGRETNLGKHLGKMEQFGHQSYDFTGVSKLLKLSIVFAGLEVLPISYGIMLHT